MVSEVAMLSTVAQARRSPHIKHSSSYTITSFLDPFHLGGHVSVANSFMCYPSTYLHVCDFVQNRGQQSYRCQLWTSRLDGQSCPQQLAGPHMSPWEWWHVLRHSGFQLHPVRGPHCQAAGKQRRVNGTCSWKRVTKSKQHVRLLLVIVLRQVVL